MDGPHLAAAETREMHPIAVRAASLVASGSERPDIADLRRELCELFEAADLLWALESLVVLARRLEVRGAAGVAAEVMELARTGTGSLRLQTSEAARAQLGAVLRRVGGALGQSQTILRSDVSGEPAWKLERIFGLPRRA